MENEMIERVARFLCAQDRGPSYPRIDARWSEWADDATRLLHLMREPTDAMVKAGDEDTREWASAYTAYQAMIDAALSPSAQDSR